ncbi:CXD4 protein, partial [Psilopogon haemacephalus]|nr:CXD4 protein [Psilopogon haemacephalus]
LGKVWLLLTVLLRLAVVVLAGYPLYQDEQERFVCNTLQPGCSNVCYDLFSPVSHFRFWLVQTVSVLLPSAAFSVYVLHKAAMHIVRMHCLAQGCQHSKGLSSPEELCASAVAKRSDCGAHNLSVLSFSGAYTLHLCFRTLLEAAFAAAQYFLFGFLVPERFSCYHSPCTSTIDCYISRPTEKSIMMVFIWGVSGLSLLLSLVDLVCALRRTTARKQKTKLLADLQVGEECVLNLPPVQQGSSSPQNPDCPVPNSSQTSHGSCSLLSGEEEEPILHPEEVSQQTPISNLNSNKPSISAGSCVSEDPAVQQDSTEEPLCAGGHQVMTCRQVRARFQQDSALTLRPQINSTSCLRSKKSEWV